MPTTTRTRVTTAIAVLALLALGGGSAVAAGLAKDSVTSRAIKNNSVKSKDLKDRSVASVDVKDGSLQSVDVGDGSLDSVDVRDGSLDSADVRDEGLLGTDIAEASLGTVPNATAVGGVRITPVSLSLPSTSGPIQVLAAGGNSVSLDCTGASISINVARASNGPPIMISAVLEAGNSVADSLAAGDNVVLQLLDGQFTVGTALTGGASATLDFTAFFELNAQGTNDCFYRGTLTRSP